MATVEETATSNPTQAQAFERTDGMRETRAVIVRLFARRMAWGDAPADVAAGLTSALVESHAADGVDVRALLARDPASLSPAGWALAYVVRDSLALFDRLGRTPPTDAGVVGLLNLADLIEAGTDPLDENAHG